MKQTSAIVSNTPALAYSDEGGDVCEEAERRKWGIEFAQHGWRLDRALVDTVAEFSRSYLQQLIAQGLVCVNAGVVLKAAQRVKVGDIVEIELRSTPQSQAFKPQHIPLDVMYADEHILVINKPAGLVVHPAPGHWSGTLLNGLLAYDENLSLVPRAGIVHRLDKDTSGLMVVARHRTVMDMLVRAMAARQISRKYLALAHAPWKDKETISVNLAVGRDPRNRVRMAVVDVDKSAGKPAKTDITVLGSTTTACFVRCVLHTGRTHQIRVHMASLGHPLIGDTVYGGACVSGMSRQALHAYRLAFAHPISGSPMVFEAPVPEDFQGLLDRWGLRYNRAEEL